MAKFDKFRLKHFMFESKRVVNQSLQVEIGSKHDMSAADHDLQNFDRVRLLEKLASFRFKLPCIRRILLSLVDDHVKHASDHVKLRLTLPRSDAIAL